MNDWPLQQPDANSHTASERYEDHPGGYRKDTLTGGRIKRIKNYVNNGPFMLTYGDGVGNVEIDNW